MSDDLIGRTLTSSNDLFDARVEFDAVQEAVENQIQQLTTAIYQAKLAYEQEVARLTIRIHDSEDRLQISREKLERTQDEFERIRGAIA